MKDKVFDYLKTKLAGYAGGVSDSYIKGIADHFSKTIKTEEEIATTITDGAIDLIKVGYTFSSSEIDRRTQLAAKHGLTPEDALKTKKKLEKPDEDEEMPSWAKKLMDKFGSLDGEVSSIKKAETKKQLEAKVRAGLKKAEVDEDWLIGRSLDAETEADADNLITRISGDYKDYRQKKAEEGVYVSKPKDGGVSKAASEAQAADIAKRRNSNVSEGVTGKKL